MLISFFDKKTDEKLFHNVLEAPMDYEAVWLQRSKNGICTLGQSTCYAFIFQNKETSALAHVSCFTDYKTIATEVIAYFKETYPNEKLSVFLARSPASYTQSQVEEVLFSPQDEEMESATEYFGQLDTTYQDYFIKTFNIIPQVLEMPHHCLVIDKSNTIHLFETFAVDDLDVEINEPTPPALTLFQSQPSKERDEATAQNNLLSFRK